MLSTKSFSGLLGFGFGFAGLSGLSSGALLSNILIMAKIKSNSICIALFRAILSINLIEIISVERKDYSINTPIFMFVCGVLFIMIHRPPNWGILKKS